MLTAKTTIAADNFASGNLLYTNTSGTISRIIDLQIVPSGLSDNYTISIIEVYPTGNIPEIQHCSTGVIFSTRAQYSVSSLNQRCASNLGSQIRACASGNCEIFVNYINVTEPLSSWDGYNTWKETGKL